MSSPNHSLVGLRPRRLILQIKAADMATRLGLTVTTYNRFERGERRAYLDQAIVMASMLGCKVDDLAHVPTPEQEVELFRAGQERRRDHHLNAAAGEQAAIQPRSSDELFADDEAQADHHGQGQGHIVGGLVVDDAHATTSDFANDVHKAEPADTAPAVSQELLDSWAHDDEDAE